VEHERTGNSPTPVLPEWFPPWTQELADLYYSGTTCLFILSGNVRDLIHVPSNDGGSEYCGLLEFLATRLFGSWDLVVQYDLGTGLRPRAGADRQRLHAMMQHLSGQLGDPTTWPRDSENILLRLDRLLERNLLGSTPATGPREAALAGIDAAPPRDRTGSKGIAVLLDYAQHLVPAGDGGMLGRDGRTNLVRLLGWAQNPYFKRVNTAVCLIADKLAEVNDRLVQSPHVATLEIPMPDRAAREQFIAYALEMGAAASKLSAAELAGVSNGLSLVSLDVVLSRSGPGRQPLEGGRFRQVKKSMIERQCQGLLEFIEPSHTLDLVVGHEAAKQRLREDADALARGRLEVAPMGYLICGPVGTGKTFLAECYAGSIGIPCVKLRNFRSKYVGETEGNLEQVLTVLRSLGPVIVIIDEADAALGDRTSEGDSGTSNRVFSMIASQMGDTRYRGRIVWMLLTCRPDLLPIDLKRQGRAEVHLPLFYPHDESEIREMFAAMARKNRIALREELRSAALPAVHLSGADIESVLLLARRAVIAAGRAEVASDDVVAALADFIPSVQGLEKELQEIAAVLECTQRSFLPAEWRQRIAEPDGRSGLQERLVALRRLIEE